MAAEDKLDTFVLRIRIRIFIGDMYNDIHSPGLVIWEVDDQ